MSSVAQLQHLQRIEPFNLKRNITLSFSFVFWRHLTSNYSSYNNSQCVPKPQGNAQLKFRLIWKVCRLVESKSIEFLFYTKIEWKQFDFILFEYYVATCQLNRRNSIKSITHTKAIEPMKWEILGYRKMDNSPIYVRCKIKKKTHVQLLLDLIFPRIVLFPILSHFLLSFRGWSLSSRENVASNLIDATKALLPLKRNEIDRTLL